MTHSQLRDHSFLGVTQSICPDCVRVVPAKILARDGRVYFRKQCPEHGLRDDFVCADQRWFDRSGHSAPGRLPPTMGVAPERGCPYDCGLCTEHEQHTCVAVLEITSSCNLTCPLCYAVSAPGGKHVPLDDCLRAIDRLVECEGRPEILQLSGGEPTIHPQFLEIYEYACSRPIDVVMINTNGIRLARDAAFRQAIARLKHRSEIYLQFDGFRDDANLALRGERLLDVKLRAIEALGEEGIRATLVCTLERDLNLDQVGRIIEFGLQRPWITGVCFQPATYVGRYPLPDELERRVTFPDVIRAISEQSSIWRETDFLPLPCAHPNSHTLAYAYRHEGRAIPLTRFLDVENNLDLLANGITFNRAAAQKLIGEFLSRSACGSDESCGCGPLLPTGANTLPAAGIATTTSGGVLPMLPVDNFVKDAGESFFRRAMAQDLSPADVFRITITSFMDAFNFDIRALMKSCVHHLLPSGHLVPFCAYNLLYRDGRVPLPPLVSVPVAGGGGASTRQPREVVEIS
jgi:uncharacterized radical SAM superfamily Fe-S cluster-containing enzyme